MYAVKLPDTSLFTYKLAGTIAGTFPKKISGKNARK